MGVGKLRARSRGPLFLGAIACCLGVLPAGGWAQEAKQPRQTWTAFAGYGWAQDLGRPAAIDITSVGLRWSLARAERPEGGRMGVGIEFLPVVAFHQEPETARAAGMNLLLEHHFRARGKARLVWRGGVGYLQGDDKVPPGETRHNFSLISGLGVDLATGPRTAFHLAYRFHHVSNANTGDRNPGINAHTLLLGISVTPR